MLAHLEHTDDLYPKHYRVGKASLANHLHHYHCQTCRRPDLNRCPHHPHHHLPII